MNFLNKLIQFLSTDIWRIQARKLSGRRSFWINQLRIFLLAVRGFDEDKCNLRASALTFYSLLSIVPVVAMAFGIAKGFGFQNHLEQLLLEKMPGQEEVIKRIIVFSQSMLENTQGGVIAGVGVVLLFWTVIKVLGNIEESFNDIWGIKKGRTFARKFSDYLSIMMICPILLIMSSSVTVMISSQLTFLIQKLSFLGPVADVVIYILKFLPYCVMWILFSFIYIFMPNTKVNIKSGIFAGIIAGTIYQLLQLVYINFQISVTNYGAIYGSFAALPLFLMWLQISWVVVLFGAEISFAEQNVDTYEFEPDSMKASRHLQKLCALCIAHLCVKRFHKGEAPLEAGKIADTLEMPIRLVNLLLFELTESGVLNEVKQDNGRNMAYQPARDIEDMNIALVLAMMDSRGANDIPLITTDEIRKIQGSLAELEKMAKSAPQNLALKDI
jgi:membrane protein